MLMRTDPFRELDRLAQQALAGTVSRPTFMPMDAYRNGDRLLVCSSIFPALTRTLSS